MPNCPHDHNNGWNDDLCLECGCKLRYFNDDEEREHARKDLEIIEANIEAWRKSYRREQRRR